MALEFPKPPHSSVKDLNSVPWQRWFNDVKRFFSTVGSLSASVIDFSGARTSSPPPGGILDSESSEQWPIVIQGKDGKDGINGASIPNVFNDTLEGEQGPPGKDGKDGTPGQPIYINVGETVEAEQWPNYPISTAYEAAGNVATHAALQTGVHGINITAAKTLSATNTLTLAGTDSTTMTFPSTSATVARTDAAQTFTGNQTFTNNIIASSLIDASAAGAGQIKFPSTQNASSDTRTLDDYSEGSWTPTITFLIPGDLTVVYSVRTGKYTKIGNLVTVIFNISTSTFTFTTASGLLLIQSLPFTALTDIIMYGPIAVSGMTTTRSSFATQSNGTSLVISLCGSGLAGANAGTTNFATGTNVAIYGQIAYRV